MTAILARENPERVRSAILCGSASD